jgi:hypothetical protein
MLKVLVGDYPEYLSFLALKKDPSAFLCTNDNISTVISGTVYTSLGDLSIQNFQLLINRADIVEYYPPTTWSSIELRDSTLIQLNFLSHRKKIKNFKCTQYPIESFWLADQRKTDARQVWVVGCSFAHGAAIQPSERFGSLIAEQLNLPVSFLTFPGTSISWAADQILRSDIRKDDIVIWGLTGCGRFSFVGENNNVYPVTTNDYHHAKEFKMLVKENFLVSNHLLQDAITKIAQVTQTLDRLAIKYILGVFPLNDEQREKQFLQYVSQNKNSLLLYHPQGFIDLGRDDSHPGPKHHKWYADTILDFYNEIK